MGDLHGLNPRPQVGPEAPIREVIIAISAGRLGAAAVLTAAGELVGIITDGDLRRMLQRFEDFGGIRAAEIMTHHPLTVETDVFAVVALETMRARNITQLVVTDGGVFAGFLHLHDLLREGLV